MNIYDIDFHKTGRGDSPAMLFLDSLPVRLRAKVAAWLGMLSEKGPALKRPYADTLEGAIRELRVGHGHMEARILFFIHGKRIILTNGFMKKAPRVPRGEIDRAIRYHREWLNAHGGGHE